ncbi:hypothetical protein [Methylobacterium sp. WL6]|jgi:hypothetical protein|uniref:hypothetical protein n=1 Tax=Methylobacterium sp. WL6 TaxID=2603901 RepID=UPI0011CB1F55|nr:hypothetical protein [Methylobacterium sp. WL6]TXN73690.1 hypothetical protein FV230_00180 [Methylobacterium sp. WL6]
MASKKVLKRRLYNVSAAAHYLLDQQQSVYLRAIKLYEMQIAVFFGEKLNVRQRKRKEFPDRWLAVSSDLLAAARVCSAIRLLQHIRKARRLDETALPSLLDDPAAREVLGRVLEEPVGLRKLAIALRPRALDIKLRNRRRRQRRYAGLYDISLRWKIDPKSTLKGGWSTAAKLFKQKEGTDAHVTIRQYYPYLGGKTRTYEIADEDDFLAAFVWLSQYGDDHFRPRQIEKASFARKLLSDAKDVTRLGRIFGRYEFVKACLEERNYALLALDLGALVTPEPVAIAPLTEELLDAILTIKTKA